jgi:hypothetical protein
MKLLTIFIFMIMASSAFAEVFTDIALRPCDPKIAAKWSYTPTPVSAPGTPKMPFHCEGDVKVFEVTAEVVMSTFDESYEPGPIYTWGYNGSNPGPVMEMLQGEKIKIIFKNNLPDPTVLHFHGLEVPFNQDGAEGHSQISVNTGETFIYQWDANQHGTFMYHSGQNIAKQLSMGLVGFLIIHPEIEPETLVDQDFLYFLQMYSLPPHSVYPDVMEMVMFNYFTFNGKSAPYTPSPLSYVGQKVRLRFANMSMMEHPVHLHGHTWRVVATGAGDNPRSTHTFGNTILVPTAQTMDVIIDEINTPGEWMFHCHLPHHVTNNMDIDTVPGEPMYMGSGGMHAVFKVFRGINDPGYVNPNVGQGGETTGGGHGGGHSGMGAPKITTYDGNIKMSDGKKVDVSLELFKAQEDKDWRKLKAFLKVFLNKDEFIVYEYDQVKYNFDTGLLSLESNDKSITLSNLMYMDEGDVGSISGEATVDFGSAHGDLNISTRDESMTDIKLKNDLSISGEYEGICDGKKKNLQINVARGFRNENIENNNPLANFIFSGVIGSSDGVATRVESSIKEGYYDPFKSVVSLKMETNGAISPLNCTPSFKSSKLIGLDCNNSCKFQKKSANTLADTTLNLPATFKTDMTKVISELDDSSALKGNYTGLVRLKNSSQIPMRLKIIAKRYATNPMILTKNFISGVVELVMPNNKLLTYKIKERQFLDSSAKINQNKNLLALETHNKLQIVVSRWSEKTISGDIYHQDYGLMGSFQTDKNNSSYQSVLTAPETLNLLKGIDGVFSNDLWTLNLESSEQEEESMSSVYSPLHIKGSLKTKDGSLSLNIIDGTYDFAINVIQLKTEDGRVLKGMVRTGEIEMILSSKPVRRTKYLEIESSKIRLMRN